MSPVLGGGEQAPVKLHHDGADPRCRRHLGGPGLVRALALLVAVLVVGHDRLFGPRPVAARRPLPVGHDRHHSRLPRGGRAHAAFQVFTIVFVLVGVGSALYALGVLLETLVEGRHRPSASGGDAWSAASLAARPRHRVRLGQGRAGDRRRRSAAGPRSWSIDNDPDRVDRRRASSVEGDATDDEVLARPASTGPGRSSPRSTPMPTTCT